MDAGGKACARPADMARAVLPGSAYGMAEVDGGYGLDVCAYGWKSAGAA